MKEDMRRYGYDILRDDNIERLKTDLRKYGYSEEKTNEILTKFCPP